MAKQSVVCTYNEKKIEMMPVTHRDENLVLCENTQKHLQERILQINGKGSI
jgi:hypothetical protein